jgi:hypothetical protein
VVDPPSAVPSGSATSRPRPPLPSTPGQNTPRPSLRGSEDRSMKDLAYLGLTLIVFIASWLYVKGLERL